MLPGPILLEMHGKASIYCVKFITALDAQVGLLLVNRREIFSTDDLQYADFQKAQEALNPDQTKLLALEAM
jgi:hypothetical protein